MAVMPPPHDTSIKNIGGGGLRLTSDSEVRRGDTIEVEVDIPCKPPIFMVCKVVWIKKPALPGEEFEMGVEFLNIDPLDRETLINLSSG